MAADILAGLEGSALAAALRGSTWLYPLVNAAHVVGVALLFGAIAPFDLKLMGAWRGVPAAALLRVLAPTAAAGLALAAVAGGLLFITDAPDYAASGLFRAKMAVLAVGVANALLFHALRRRAGGAEAVPAGRLLGALSLAVWLAVIGLGRLVGYF